MAVEQEACDQPHKAKVFSQTLGLEKEMQARPLETRERKHRVPLKVTEIQREFKKILTGNSLTTLSTTLKKQILILL